jgi:hypothetical protein
VIDYARIAREIFEASLGNITPPMLEGMTYDQLHILWLDRRALGAGPQNVGHDEAVAMGLVEPGGKTGVQMALEQAEKDRKRAARAAKRAKRRAAQEAALAGQHG